jgi:hypothetical protein
MLLENIDFEGISHFIKKNQHDESGSTTLNVTRIYGRNKMS